ALVSSDAGKTLMLTVRIEGKDLKIPCGYNEWKKGRGPLPGGRLAQFPDEPMAGTFAWSGEDTCLVKFCGYETPFHTTYKLKFDGDQMTLDSEANVAFGPTKRPQLVARTE
ncbi:MAG: penicillin-binding protein beta-lactamase class, partial [Verrucomicrobiales bacterium]|nr:penicillin-binding protein beta-lactamase class [Verrucomicrobiales bacterium]